MSEYRLYAPSYKRPNDVTTQKYLSQCVYVVAESEAKEYEKAGHKLWVVPDSAQGNLCRIRNYILNNAEEENIIILDDDYQYLGYWEQQKQYKMKEEQVYEFIEHALLLIEDLDIHFWGLNCIPDKKAYREYSPFSFKSYIGGPFQAFRNTDLRYDEKLPLKEDYDMSLQMLNKYRRILRFNQFHYKVEQHTNQGGCAAYRTIQKEKDQFKLLQKKWGSNIVRVDDGKANVNRKKKNTYDINPIIKVPIKGI